MKSTSCWVLGNVFAGNICVFFVFQWICVIWTDGRELPKYPEQPRWETKDAPPADPKWWGYSVGKWMDDFTFVAQSDGFHDGTWLDNAGRPHSDAMRVEERYRRVDRDHLEMTITIDDPKMYTKPWVAL